MANKLVLAVTGGGTEAIGNMLSVGGASSYFLEGVVPYSNKSLDDFLGFAPKKYCSEQTARQMAAAAFQRALYLGAADVEALGVACTASLVKPSGEREGREHVAYLARADLFTSESISIKLLEKRSRKAEEDLIAKTIELYASGGAAASYFYLTPDEREALVYRGSSDRYQVKKLFVDNQPQYYFAEKTTSKFSNSLIFPGSFNPFHDGHASMMKEAYKRTKRKIFLEISVTNVDKPPIDYVDINYRVNSITNYLMKDSELMEIFGGIILSNTPTFTKKVWLYPPGVDYLVGGDTAKRILDIKYGSVIDLMDALMVMNAKFYVTPREGHEVYVPIDFKRHFEFLDCSIPNISSTRIREEQIT